MLVVHKNWGNPVFQGESSQHVHADFFPFHGQAKALTCIISSVSTAFPLLFFIELTLYIMFHLNTTSLGKITLIFDYLRK